MTKRNASLVWRFFDRIEEGGRVTAVLCRLCDTQYKYFGNTTNLKSHLVRKHPIQWDLLTTGSLDETARQRLENADGEESSCQSPPITRKPRGFKNDKNVCYSVSINQDNVYSREDSQTRDTLPRIEIERVDTSDIEVDHDNEEETAAVKYLVKNMHTKGSDEEWLEEDPFQTTHFETYEPKRKKPKVIKIKREVESPARRQSYYQSTPVVVRQDQNPRPEPRDEYSVFGEYVANKLRKFKAPRTRGNIQQLITTILWQAEYGVYDDAEAVKRVLMIPMVQRAEPAPSVNHIQEVQSDPQQEPNLIVETETFND